MPGLDALLACAGSWKGTNILHDPNTQRPEESPGTARVTPILGDRFVRVEYTWSYRGKPQEGCLLIGFDPNTRTISVHWIDTWHMGHAAFIGLGPDPEGGTFQLLGSYAAPPGPDWGWRIEITAGPGVDALRIDMHNIWPGGEREEPAVEAVFTRVADAMTRSDR
ncbi:MAG TPA: DUF1579 family protein [Candidatus Eisenbacteria bacterium]|nr:DUF1579 family protein [Candidatus Eisenbacteria bacterium]